MDEDLRAEKVILKVSFIGSFLCLAAEIIMAFYSNSRTIMMDCIFDVADILMLGPFMFLVPLLYKPETEKRPYGFSQVESLFLIIKYGILIVITAMLLIDNVVIIVNGGNHIDAGMVAAFEMAMAFVGFVMFFILRYMNRKFSSPTLKADLCMWRIDAFSTLGVGAAFICQYLLGDSSWAGITPYIDPVIAVVMSLILIKEPVEMFIESIRNLILFAPGEDIVADIRERAEEVLDGYGCEVSFTDVIKTGRKLWIEVYFRPHDKLINIDHVRSAHRQISEKLEARYDDIYLEIIPEIEEKKPEGDI